MAVKRSRIIKAINLIIPKGSGQCSDCSKRLCRSCSSRIAGARLCFRCDGKGIDRHGWHCCSCRNNHEEWGGSKNVYKLRDLYESLAVALSER